MKRDLVRLLARIDQFEVPVMADAVRLESVRAHLVWRDLDGARHDLTAIEKPLVRARAEGWVAQVSTLVR